jgi:hypothetical protein
MKGLITDIVKSTVPEATVEVDIGKIVGTRAVKAYITIPYEVFTK